jgi:XTP/dITP diphosphohydrolase
MNCVADTSSRPRRRLLVATGNPGKVRELRRLLEAAGLELDVLMPVDAGVDLEVAEDGATFEANAEAKARAFAEAAGVPAVGDDSGLEVDALGGRPGVRSARYAGVPHDDAGNNAKLLRELADVPDERRGARFVCVLALVVPAAGPAFAGVEPGGVRFFRGACPGRVVRAPRGSGGFGYDPLFVPSGGARTFAELGAAEKDAASHRGRALRSLVGHLAQSGLHMRRVS